MYDHLFGNWLATHGTWQPVVSFLRANVNGPFAIIQDFGFFGVVLFFLISGFIITHVGGRESRGAFAIKRILRIYPPLIASLVVVAVSDHVMGLPPHSTSDYFWAATLLNYFRVPQIAVNGVAWSLTIEIVFYLLMCLSLTWLKTRPVTTALTSSALCLLVIATARDFGAGYFLFAATVGYVPFLLLGQATYYVWSGRISFYAFVAVTVAALTAVLANLHQIQPQFLDAADSYGVNFAYAYLLFIACAAGSRAVRVPAPLAATARGSYSLYLLHGPVGLAILESLWNRIGYASALVIAILAIAGATYLSYRFIELPSQRLARWIVRRDRSAVAVPAVIGVTL